MSFHVKNKLPKKTRFLNSDNLPDISNLIKDCLKLWDHKKFILKKNGIKTMGPANLYRFVGMHSSSNLSKSIWYDCLMSCDQKIPGSSKYAAAILANRKDPKIIGKVSSKRAFDISVSGIRNKLSRRVIRTLFEELSSKAVIQLLTSNDIEPIIEISNDIILSAKIDPIFSKITKNSDIFYSDPKVIVIDGYIASIAEINRFLESANSSRENYIILARGYHEEVSTTLGTNFSNKRLNVVPLKFGNELSNINFLADACAVSGATPISSNLGDTIDKGINDLEKRGKLRMFSYSENKISVKSDLDLEKYISNLKTKLNLETQEDKQKLLSARISNLTSERIEVRIPKSNDSMFEDCDDFIKTYRNIVESGILELENFGIVPINCYIEVRKITNDFRKNISEINGAIIVAGR